MDCGQDKEFAKEEIQTTKLHFKSVHGNTNESYFETPSHRSQNSNYQENNGK